MTEQTQDPQPQSIKSATVSFGERMKREREMRGVKLEEIAESTKIGKRNLVALEQEQFDQLPGGIFNKGFVRAYAKYLGLDEEQAVNDFMAASANYDQPVALQPPPTSWVKPPVMLSDEALRRRNLLWVLLAAVLLVGGFIGWFYWKSHPRISEDADQPRPTQAMAENNSAIRSDPSQKSTQTNSRPATGDSAGEQIRTSGGSSSAASNASPPSTSTAAAATKAAPKKGIFTVKIQAKEDSWVNVTSDGRQVMDIVIPAGQERTIHARQELVLKTGNAGGIEVAHNGAALPPLGSENEVKTLTFNARGLQH